MKMEIHQASAKLELERPSSETLSVQMRVHEQGSQSVRGKESGAAVVTAAESGLVRWVVLGAVLAIAALYVGMHIGSGWVPADEGYLGQSALRVLQGQLPQRDFAEIYSGGLAMIHAAAFRILGVSLMSLRLCAFVFCLAWIPAVYYIALRFINAPAAGLITLLAVSWSYPNYPAAMPSWYNLFFATFGAAALLRYLDVRRSRWLFVAGLCGGVSILIKVIGAYYIAGALLFLVFLEQSDLQTEVRMEARMNVRNDESEDDKSAGPMKSSVFYRLFSATALLLFMATVIYVFHARLGMAEFFQFVLPSFVLVALTLLGERKVRQAATSERFRRLLRLLIPFIGGILTPVIVFLIPYLRSGAVTQFVSGVTASAVAHAAELGVLQPVGIEKSIAALVLAALLALAMYWREFQGKVVGAAVGLGLTVMLVKAATSNTIVSEVWYSVATLTPLVVLVAAAVVLSSAKWCTASKLQRQRMMVPVSLAAICGLVQHPFAAPIYLCYALPLTLLAVVATVATAKKRPGTYVLAAVAVFYLLFGTIRLVPDHVYELTHKVGPMEVLKLPRSGGLRIEYAAEFADLIHLLQQHSSNGLMYAGNDCPELYFLSGLRNVTRDDAGVSAEEVLKAMQSDDLKLVVINEAPFFPSSRMNPEVRAEVMRKFPNSTERGFFHVFWRE